MTTVGSAELFFFKLLDLVEELFGAESIVIVSLSVSTWTELYFFAIVVLYDKEGKETVLSSSLEVGVKSDKGISVLLMIIVELRGDSSLASLSTFSCSLHDEIEADCPSVFTSIVISSFLLLPTVPSSSFWEQNEKHVYNVIFKNQQIL